MSLLPDLPARLVERAENWRKVLTAIAAAATVVALTASAWAAIWGPVRGYFDDQASAQAALLAETAAQNARLAALEATVAEVQREVRRATGDDKVLRQVANLSYIVEPVYQGEMVTMIMVAERTTLGRDCRLTAWVPLFADERGIVVPGEPAHGGGPPRRQITDERTRLEIRMIAPPRLLPGRIEVYLDLTYSCPTGEISQATDPVVYELVPGERG